MLTSADLDLITADICRCRVSHAYAITALALYCRFDQEERAHSFNLPLGLALIVSTLVYYIYTFFARISSLYAHGIPPR